MLFSDLNNALSITEALSCCETAAPEIPGFTVCPVCRQRTLYVVRPVGEAGGWYQCQGRCGFSGDSLDLMAAHAKLPLDSFLRNHRMSSAPYTPENITKHMEAVRQRQRFQEGWRQVSARAEMFLSPPEEVRNILADAHLSSLADSGCWDAGPGRLIGAANNARVNELFGNGGLRPLPGPNSRAWLLTPTFSAPGLMTGLAALDREGRLEYHHARRDRDALLFLNQPHSRREDCAYAIGSIRHALALHAMAQHDQAGQPPVLSWLPESDQAWRHVKSRQVVFWAPEIDLEVLVQAHRVGDPAFIARAPLPAGLPDDPREHWRGETCGMVLERLRHVAEPWLLVLKDYLVACARSPVIDQVPRRLPLSPREIDKLAGYCANDGERAVIGDLYRAGPIETEISLGGDRYIQTKDGWFKLGRQGRTLVSAAIPVIHTQVLLDPGDSSRSILFGHLTVAGRERRVDFQVPYGKFEHNWLRAQASALAGVAVHIETMNALKLFQLAISFSQPRTTPGLARQGWDTELAAFRFTGGAVLTGGKIDEEPKPGLVKHPLDDFLPAREPTPEQAREWFADNEYADFWRIWLTGLQAMLAPALGQTPAAAAVYGPEAGLVEAAGQALYGKILRADQLDDLKAELDRHAAPVWVARRGGGVADLLRLPDPHNLVAELDNEENASLAQLLGWWVVGVEAARPAAPPGAGSLLGPLLAHHQRRPADPGLSGIRPALAVLRDWLDKTHELRPAWLARLADRVSLPEPGPAGAGRRLLGLARLLLRAGELAAKVDDAERLDGLPPGRKEVTIKNEMIYLPWEAFSRALNRNRLPGPGAAGAQTALEAAGAETVTSLGVPQGWWVEKKTLFQG